jgi:hypothetical protein
MGVNHGGGREGRIPPELAVGDANTSCPPRFLSCFKISSARHGFAPPPQISTQIYATDWRLLIVDMTIEQEVDFEPLSNVAIFISISQYSNVGY